VRHSADATATAPEAKSIRGELNTEAHGDKKSCRFVPEVTPPDLGEEHEHAASRLVKYGVVLLKIKS
jgi:hypothetical protein